MNGALSVVPSEARAYQGRPAGLVTRLLANTIDALCVVAAVLAGYAGFNALLFMLRPRNFELVGSSVLMSLVVASAVAAVYLTVAWWITGRTYGDHLMGLRVVGPGGRRVRLLLSLARAALCIAVPIGLLWCAVSRHRRSVQDLLLRTSVIYDWVEGAGVEETHEGER